MVSTAYTGTGNVAMGQQPVGDSDAEAISHLSRNLLLVVVLLVVGLGSAWAMGIFSGAFWTGELTLPKSITVGQRHASVSPNLFPMEPVIVNARDIDTASFVRLTLTLELERPDVAETVNARLGAIQNAVVVTAASRDSAMLRSVEGKTRLREDLTKTINALLPNGGVRAVYFTDFLVR